MENLIKEMEEYAEYNDIPIMQLEGINFMCNFIKEHNIKTILEIGSAIGYSAIRMALLDKDIKIVTIERDDIRYQKAIENIHNAGLEKQITIYHDDALETIIDGTFDMLFIDAAKAQYIKFFERYETNVKKNGFIITDNLKFHGFVEHKELVTSRNLRQLVTKIGKFVEYLKNREDYETKFLDYGDGIGISRKK